MITKLEKKLNKVLRGLKDKGLITPTECKVLIAVVIGKDARTISQEMGLSIRTIEGIRSQAKMKVGRCNTVGLIHYLHDFFGEGVD